MRSFEVPKNHESHPMNFGSFEVPTNPQNFARRSTGSLKTCREPKVGTERDKTVRDILLDGHGTVIVLSSLPYGATMVYPMDPLSEKVRLTPKHHHTLVILPKKVRLDP